MSLASTADMYEHLVLLSNQEKNTSAYRQSYQQVDRLLQLIEKEYGFDQIFLTDVNGVVIYSTINKESFEGSDLSHREYFQDAIAGNQNWSSLFATTQGFNAVVLATPVFQDGFSNQTVGTLSFLIQENRITNVVHAGTEYLGETGDAYLINQDGLFYSNTRRGDLQKEAALNEVLDTQAVQLLKGPIENQDYLFSQNVQYPSYLGQEVLGTLGVFQMGDDPMGLVIEVEANEVFAGLYALRNTIVISLLLVSIAGILLAFLFARNMTKPIQETLQVLQRMANGDFSGSLSAESLTRKDETGMMSKAIHQMNDSIKEMIGNVQKRSQ
ncbi:MAG: methyl-accepting chemotaxis protein [Bacillaceae bacterium]|nr:methyl-accepting chemotaxis protein [Bacillaceae bacterium]